MHIAGKPFSPVVGNKQQDGQTSGMFNKTPNVLDKQMAEESETNVVLEKSNILMLGPTGSGVTFNIHFVTNFPKMFF